MEGLNVSSAQLIFGVLLISAIAVTNCAVRIDNHSNSFLSIIDLETRIGAGKVSPQMTGINFPYPAPVSGQKNPQHLFFIEQYVISPNESFSGEKRAFASVWLYDNATVEIVPPARADGWTKLGITVDYLRTGKTVPAPAPTPDSTVKPH